MKNIKFEMKNIQFEMENIQFEMESIWFEVKNIQLEVKKSVFNSIGFHSEFNLIKNADSIRNINKINKK